MIGLKKDHPLYQEDLQYILKTPGIDVLRGARVLVTGATGLIGVCLIDAIMSYNRQGADITIYAVGRSTEKAAARLGEYFSNNHFVFIEQDVRKPLSSSFPVDYIIPLASNTHPLAYSQYPIETIEINVKGTEFALRKALDDNATVLLPSTVEIYGNARGNDIFSEDYTGALNLSNARSCYTESKRLSEALCQSYISEMGSRVKIVRLGRVFGPTMLLSDRKASSQFIINALNREDIVLKSRGQQYYSYVYVADAVAAMLFVLLHGEYGSIYNIANDHCNVHLKDFALTCARHAGTKVIFDLPSDVERNGYSIASQAILCADKLLRLGFVPHYSFDEALQRTLKILS